MGYFPLGIFVLIIAIISFAFCAKSAYVYDGVRTAWLLFSIFPIYTVYNGFTNYGDGHLISKEQAIKQIESETYLPQDSRTFVSWVFYKGDGDDYLLWVKDDADETMIARMLKSHEEPKIFDVVSGENGIGEIDDNGAPFTIEGYERFMVSPLLQMPT